MGRLRTWAARWTRVGSHMVAGGEHRVWIEVRLTTPVAQEYRPVEIELSADMARHLADRLIRHADTVDEYNARRASATEGEDR